MLDLLIMILNTLIESIMLGQSNSGKALDKKYDWTVYLCKNVLFLLLHLAIRGINHHFNEMLDFICSTIIDCCFSGVGVEVFKEVKCSINRLIRQLKNIFPNA